MRKLLAKPIYLKLNFLFLHFYPIVDNFCHSRQSLQSAVMMFVGVASAEAFRIVVFHMQPNYPEIKLKILAVCQGIVFPTCAPMVWILAWWRSWKKTSKSLGPATRTISRLASSPPLLLLHHASLLTRTQTRSLSTDIPFTGICGHSICTLMGERRLPISPLRAVDCWEIAVKSHQGFINFWPCHGFLLVLRGTLVYRKTAGRCAPLTASRGPNISPARATGQSVHTRKTTGRSVNL